MGRRQVDDGPGRDGAPASAGVVIHLAAFKAARHARDVLVDLLHGPPWLVRVDIEVLATGVPRLVATIARLDHWKNCCVPSHVNDVEVRTVDAAGGPQP